MIRVEGPTCASCGMPVRGQVICTLCWAEVPHERRKAIDVAWKRYLAQPGSQRRRHEYDVAIAEAVECVS